MTLLQPSGSNEKESDLPGKKIDELSPGHSAIVSGPYHRETILSSGIPSKEKEKAVI